MLSLLDRGGAIELSIEQSENLSSAAPDQSGQSPKEPADQASSDTPGGDIIWRVKLIAIRNDAIIVEQPSAFGSTFRFRPGLNLIGAMTIGQNRWMFHTRTMAAIDSRPPSIALSLPEKVERCTRRSFYRISTASLRLPRVKCWPLMNPASVGPAEAANWALIRDMLKENVTPTAETLEDPHPESILLPEVGPAFSGQIINISGGGLGVIVDRSDMQAATSKPLWWMRVDLRPEVPAPISVTVRLVHQHIDSTQSLYCGLSFEQSQNQENRDMIIELFSRYTDELQRRQLRSIARSA